MKKISGNEKFLYLEISQNTISGKAIVYQENTRNEYTSDIHYDIKAVTNFEKTFYKGLDALVVYARTSTLYGLEKFQLILPGMKDIPKALDLLKELKEVNKGGIRPFSSLVPETPLKIDPEHKAEPEQSSEPEPAAAEAKEQQAVSAPAEQNASANVPLDELKKQFEKIEAVYQTGMISEEEYKSSKAEYISNANGLGEFYDKLKINLQYSEIGFLSPQEFADYKSATIEECSEFADVSNDVFKQNLRKLSLLNLCGILSDAEYNNIRDEIVQSVQYESDDPEDVVVEKVERWPIMEECEFLSPNQSEQFLKTVADDVKIKASDSIPVLEHKLTRLTTLSGTFIFTPEEFAQKKQDFIADMSVFDYASETKFRGQIERLMTLKRCDWLDENGYQSKKDEILQTIGSDSDVVNKMKLYGLLVDVDFITSADYDSYKQGVLDEIFSQYSDISELQKRAQTLMSLKEAAVITDAEFSDFKKKLLAL